MEKVPLIKKKKTKRLKGRNTGEKITPTSKLLGGGVSHTKYLE